MGNKSDLHTCYCSTVLYQRSVTNMGIKLFNTLAIQIKQLDNYKGFKRDVKTFHLHNSFYTIEEFFTLREFSIAHCVGTIITNCTCVPILPFSRNNQQDATL